MEFFAGKTGGLSSGTMTRSDVNVRLDRMEFHNVPFNGASFVVVPSSSRFTLSKEVVERRWEVSKGDFGWPISGLLSFASVSAACGVFPFVSIFSAETGRLGSGGRGSADESRLALFSEEERLLVSDLDLTTWAVAICADSMTAVSLASSNVSYQNIHRQPSLCGTGMQVQGSGRLRGQK